MMDFPPQVAEDLVQNAPFQNKVKSAYRWGLWLVTGSKYSDMDEQVVIEDLIDEASSEDVIFDIGSAGGLYSYYPVSDVGCTAHAFEPHPESFDNFLATVGNIESITPHQIALSDSSGEVPFVDNENNTASPSIASETSPDSEVVMVRSERGDDYIQENQIASPTIVKIDVEGAELDVLRGMKKTLTEENCRLVYVEVHLPTDDDSPDITDFGGEPGEVRQLLESLGFSTEIVFERSRDFHIKAKANIIDTQNRENDGSFTSY